MKDSIEIVKEGKLSFFYTVHNVLLTPLCFHFYIFLLLHNFIIFPPQFFLFPPPPHRPYIDPTSTPHRPYIDPRLNFFQHSFVKSVTIYNHKHISIVFSPPPPPHFYCFHSSHITKQKEEG